MTSITGAEWLAAFGDAIASGDLEGALRALQSQATSHAGTAPAAEKRAAAKETLARVQAEALAADKRRPVWMAVGSAAKNLAKRDPERAAPELRRWLLGGA